VGTSLPEVVTSAVAALRGDHEIAVANVVGSNVFNLLGVLGLTGALVTLPIDGGLYRFELPALAISTVALFLLAWPRARIGRREGIVLLAAYVVFVTIVLVRGGS
jgi:cation:H+ antiporter